MTMPPSHRDWQIPLPSVLGRCDDVADRAPVRDQHRIAIDHAVPQPLARAS